MTAMRARGEAKRWPLLVLTGAVVAAGRVELELWLVVVVLRAVGDTSVITSDSEDGG